MYTNCNTLYKPHQGLFLIINLVQIFRTTPSNSSNLLGGYTRYNIMYKVEC
ncbi:hypothetical protein VPHK460_0170 [Vibrio phage K460]